MTDSRALIKKAILFSVFFSMASNGWAMQSEGEDRPKGCITHQNSNDILFERAKRLRQMVADTLDGGNLTNSMCNRFMEIGFESFQTEEFFKQFAVDSCSASCGLASNILVKLLNDSGIIAYSYNFGFAGSDLTHVVVLAKVDSGIWSVHDPTFNYSVVDGNGKPKDFFQLLKSLNRCDLDDTHVTEDTVWRSVLIDTLKQYPLSEKCTEVLKSLLVHTERISLIRRPICFGCVLGGDNCPELDFISRMEARLDAEGLPRNFLSAMTRPLNRVWGPNPESFQLLVDSAFLELEQR
jgi:hypothetical protein